MTSSYKKGSAKPLFTQDGNFLLATTQRMSFAVVITLIFVVLGTEMSFKISIFMKLPRREQLHIITKE